MLKYAIKMGEALDAEISSGKTRYSSTNNRYAEVAQHMVSNIKKLSQILQTDYLASEFDTFDDSGYVTNDQFQTFVRSLNQIHISTDPALSLTTYESQSPEAFVEDYQDIPKSDFINILKNYNRILEATAKTVLPSSIANECASLIWRWYEARIIKKYKQAPTFNYCVHRIKRIIYNLVIVFGYYHEQGNLDKFLSEFNTWVDQLSISPRSNTWIAPYEVFQVEKNMDKVYANVTSVVLWDILLDNGFNELCSIEPYNNVYPDDDRIMEMVNDLDIDVLDPYVNYKIDSRILDQYRLI